MNEDAKKNIVEKYFQQEFKSQSFKKKRKTQVCNFQVHLILKTYVFKFFKAIKIKSLNNKIFN